MHTTIKQKRRRRAIVPGILALLICLGAMYLPVHGEEDVYDAVIRLHVLANSDSDEDQALKMQVRNAVLTRAAKALEGCSDRDEAARRLTHIIPQLTTVSWAYPITWTLSSIVFLIYFLKADWIHNFDRLDEKKRT